MTIKDTINRGYNLMITAVLFFDGLAFAVVAASPVENDWGDRLDDIGLALVGLVSLIWYLSGRNRFKHSLVPLILGSLAIALQTLAILLERDDPAAFGDNYIGLALLVPFFIFAIAQFSVTGRLISAPAGAKPSA